MDGTTEHFRSHVEEILDALEKEPDREALVHGSRRVSAGELRGLVYGMARALRSQGLRRGHTVTLLSGNLPETIAARYAAGLLGCAVNHLYAGLSADVHADILRDVETRALIVDPAHRERAADLARRVPPARVLVLGAGGDAGPDLVELAAEESTEVLPGSAHPQDICTIRHTGGTTGHPKAICTTFEQWVSVGSDWPEGGQVRALVCTTLAHAAGLMADTTLHRGGTVVLQDEFEPGAVLAAIERERISHVFLLPPLLYQLMDHPDVDRTDTSSLRMLTYGGCASSPTRLAAAVRRFGPVLNQFYGQNEAGGISMLSPEDHDPRRPELLRTAGKIMEGVEVAVRDADGRHLPPGEHGELCVRSPHVMKGYWKQPELTAEVLRDGWLHTGDIGFVDADGYVTIVDRLKDMIVVVGGHVYTVELEDVLNSHPQVLQSAVLGVPDANLMERVHAVVVRTPDGDVGEKELRAMVRERKGAMYEPASITFIDALPLTDAGKPDKKLLRGRALDRRGK
ncbi:AMP-binding protein [Streptomyces sp. NBC_00320]|uniref:AMP-binding protein n=1 Tax=unclassified Streptomyces TaxID=2593676 RepID=UPI002252C07A|nr:AMP-binding protein [Streptomyces sp. NBC_00320]MCX5149956.1 AMP-binding protein [Streptomyces sp. NBC_00320]